MILVVKRWRAIAISLLATGILAACATAQTPTPPRETVTPATPAPAPESPGPAATPATPVNPSFPVDIPVPPEFTATYINPTDFALPDCEILNNIGRPIPCPMRGIIALPDAAGPRPLVVLLHGVRAIDDVNSDDTYTGFDYLIQELAASGYVAISINIAVDYTFDYGESSNYEWAMAILRYHLDQLARANAGENVGYGIDIASRIDLSRIHLVGHSRGAQIADIVARIDHGENPFPWAGDTWATEQWPPTGQIRSVTALGFVEAIGVDGYPANIPYAILVAELDEDDHFNDGERLFEAAAADPARTEFATMALLAQANHAYFNRTFPNRVPNVTVLERTEQEAFTRHFVTAFLAGVDPVAPSATPGVTPNSLLAPNISYCAAPEIVIGTVFDQTAHLTCIPAKYQ